MIKIIFEMARNKRELERKISDKNLVIIKHLAKIFMLNSVLPETVSHWEEEIYSFLNEVDKLKTNNKYPDAKFIFNCTYGISGDTTDEAMDFVARSYRPEGIRIPAYAGKEQEFNNFVKDYFIELSTILSSKGNVTKQEVKSIIERLMDKYCNK